VRALRDNGLAIFFGVACLATIAAEAFVGHDLYNEEQLAHSGTVISLGRYVTSSDFGARLMENWQSEFLQFATFILAAVWLVQRGSQESKPPEKAGPGDDEEQKVGGFAHERSPDWAKVGGIRTKLYENSLGFVMLFFFLATWFAQAVTSWNVFNSEQLEHHEHELNLLHYLGTSDFWDRSLQNWQSEFMAVGTMAVFTVYLRQRGSPESKPVGEPHEASGG
jgi:hypothetical protein